MKEKRTTIYGNSLDCFYPINRPHYCSKFEYFGSFLDGVCIAVGLCRRCPLRRYSWSSVALDRVKTPTPNGSGPWIPGIGSASIVNIIKLADGSIYSCVKYIALHECEHKSRTPNLMLLEHIFGLYFLSALSSIHHRHTKLWGFG